MIACPLPHRCRLVQARRWHPEHSDGLDDYDVPSRTAAAGESTAETIRRIIVYGDTNSAPTPDGSMERLGTVMTSAGRRSGRLTSLAATGGGTAAEDPETQAILLRSLQAERTVVARLRAELPPPDDDWSESGGDVLPGAQFEVDVQSDDMTAATQDVGDVFIDDDDDPESTLTYSVPTVTTTTTMQDADPPTNGSHVPAGIPSVEPDDGVVPEGPPLGDRTDDDSGVVGVTQGAAEGALTHEALRSTDDGARRSSARLMAARPTDNVRQPRTLRTHASSHRVQPWVLLRRVRVHERPRTCGELLRRPDHRLACA